MLEAVVQQEQVRPDLLPGGQARGITGGPGVDRGPGQGAGQPVGLFARLRRFLVNLPAVGDASDPLVLAAVTPAENGHLAALSLKKTGKAGGHRGLAGAAHGQVADAHHRGRQTPGPENGPGIESPPHPGPQAVERGQPPGHRPQGTPGRRGLLPCLETIKEAVPVRVHAIKFTHQNIRSFGLFQTCNYDF